MQTQLRPMRQLRNKKRPNNVIYLDVTGVVLLVIDINRYIYNRY